MPRATPLADPVYCGGGTRGRADSGSNSAAVRYSTVRLGTIPARFIADAIATVGVARNSYPLGPGASGVQSPPSLRYANQSAARITATGIVGTGAGATGSRHATKAARSTGKTAWCRECTLHIRPSSVVVSAEFAEPEGTCVSRRPPYGSEYRYGSVEHRHWAAAARVTRRGLAGRESWRGTRPE